MLDEVTPTPELYEISISLNSLLSPVSSRHLQDQKEGYLGPPRIRLTELGQILDVRRTLQAGNFNALKALIQEQLEPEGSAQPPISVVRWR